MSSNKFICQKYACMNCSNPAYIGDVNFYVLCKDCYEYIWGISRVKSINRKNFFKSIREEIAEEIKLKAEGRKTPDKINPQKITR